MKEQNVFIKLTVNLQVRITLGQVPDLDYQHVCFDSIMLTYSILI